MTININLTNGVDRWAPGVFFFFESSIVQPGTPPFTIVINLWRTTPESLLWQYIPPVQPTIRGGLKIGYDLDGIPLLMSRDASPAPQDQVRLQITARDDSGVQVDQGERTMPWSDTAQLHNELVEIRSIAQGGFTAQDRANAEITQMGVSIPLPGLGLGQEIASGLTGFFTSPPSWAMQVLETILLEGTGVVDRPGAGRQVNAYGAQVDHVSILPSLGRLNGSPITYHDRITQISVVDVGLANREFYRVSWDLYQDHQRVNWGTPFPLRVEYSVLPGCIVSLTWTHLAPSWWPFQ